MCNHDVKENLKTRQGHIKPLMAINCDNQCCNQRENAGHSGGEIKL